LPTNLGVNMPNFSMYEIIDKKKRGKTLSKEEIDWVINGLMKKKITDYQMTALLMAIFLKGMTTEETANLTDAMLYSGKVMTFEGKNVVDKHSTGGIGDKASFILAPIAAACGVKVPMIAGRGLGFTGGTVDKVESIKGFKTNLPLAEFEKLLNKKGMVLIGQTKEIAPADGLIYALRDVTATIDSIPLITASIMSKKLAEGANGIVMDIKTGSGAFMGSHKEAQKLAHSILGTAKRFNKASVALITNMDQPLGNAVGNSLEIIESVEVLKGQGPKDITELSVALAARMIHIGGVEKSYAKSLKKAKEAVASGAALNKFKEMIKNQGGDISFINDYSKLPIAKHTTEVLSIKDGWVKSYKNDEIGLLATELGGGRKVKSDKIDFGVGFVFHKNIGDKVKKGESIFTIYHNKNQSKIVSTIIERFFADVIKFSKTKVATPMTIHEVIEAKDVK
jgi:pyrimidine-nucleoside phosphorylase